VVEAVHITCGHLLGKVEIGHRITNW
jgi:hypothetical protein